ncbi:unnamed protein product [Ophioblennius macclurei]
MRWFGFGFNAFGQICAQDESTQDESVDTVKVIHPTELRSHVESSRCSVRASWSRRASLRFNGDSCVYLAGFGSRLCTESRSCKDVYVTESHLTLVFEDRVESWDLQKEGEETPAWCMEIKPEAETLDDVSLPLVPGGYVISKAPFYRTLSPQLKAKSLALGAEHALLLSASGAVYTWGLGSHGQLGHSTLLSEEEPRAVEALWGMPMSSVASGGWHSVCISNGGDLYVWGWNESGQLGLPSQCLRKASQEKSGQKSGELRPHPASSSHEEEEEEKKDEVFISIQAFPALLDLTPPCEIRAVSCGSRHTAAVTVKGDLYTWGWGEYGQLGHQTFTSSDEPQRVEFFSAERMQVADVICGAWTTFAAVVKEEEACPQ